MPYKVVDTIVETSFVFAALIGKSVIATIPKTVPKKCENQSANFSQFVFLILKYIDFIVVFKFFDTKILYRLEINSLFQDNLFSFILFLYN